MPNEEASCREKQIVDSTLRGCFLLGLLSRVQNLGDGVDFPPNNGTRVPQSG